MVDDLLDVARITSGRIQLRRRRVELAQIVEEAVHTGEPLIRGRRQKLSVDLPAEPVELDGDPVRLAQVLTNLLSNAAKYTAPGGRIALHARCEGEEAVVSVRDTGSGIEPELLPHIFDLFVQSDTSLDRTDGGLGLGLTLVRQLTEMHGGCVEARSPGLDQGSEFIVRLPLPGSQAAPARAGTPEPGPSHRRVLVVEDNPDVGQMLVALLRGLGHEVVLAKDGPTALERAAGFDPEIAFIDLGLPGMDGYEVARRLRKEHPKGGDMVLATLSGYGPVDAGDAAVADHHLLKPATIEELNAVLQDTRPPGTVKR